MTTDKSSAPVDVLAPMDDAAHALNHTRTAPERIALIEARDAVAKLIERDKGAQFVFDCILRGINDANVSRFGDGWLHSWAKSMLSAGFSPSNPGAIDIRGGLARVQGT